MRRYLYTIVCFLTCLSAARAQQSVRFDNYSIEEGLSQSTVTDICQTNDGFIWFATSDGLNRFDGYNFTAFKHVSGDAGSLSSNYTRVLAEDDGGNLWVGTNEGDINIFDKTSQQFVLLKALSDSNTGSHRITAIKNDGQGNMWIGTEGAGIARYNIKSAQLSIFNTQNSTLISNRILCLHIDNDKNIWYGTRNGASYFKRAPDREYTDTFSPGSDIYVIGSSGGHVYIAADALYRISGNMQPVRVSLPGETSETFHTVTALMPDSKGNLWIGTQFRGLFRLSTSGLIESFQNDPLNKNSLCNNIVYSAIEDRTGNLWFGTYSGISCIRPLNQQLQLIQRDPRKSSSLSNNNIYYTYQDNYGKIWLATLEGGLNQFNPSDQTVVNYSMANTTGLRSNSIRCIYQDSKNQYWVGTGDANLFRFYPESRRFEAFQDRLNFTITSDRILCIFEDKSHNYWIGTANGLNYYDANNDTLGYVRYDTVNYDNNNVYEIKQDITDPNILIVASFGNGLQFLDIAQQQFVKTFRHDPKNPHSISNNQLMCINQINADTLLIGTFGGGLNIFNRRTGQFTAITQQDGLPNDAVYGILRDKKGYIWMSTNKGLSRLDLKKMKFKNFDQINLVQSLEFNEGAYMATREGYFYFGGINGLNIFKPESIIENTSVPPVEITGFNVLDKALPFRSILARNGEIELKYNQNFISIDFVALNYINPEKTTYAYMLEGIDEDWVMAGNKRTANYTKLPPGNYVFRVKAANEDGVWNQVGASISIVITPPFWKTWWFFALLGIAALGTIYFALHMRTNAIRRSYQAQMTEVELKALRSQMNPHFIFNSINSIQYYILNKNAKTAYTYLSKFSSLMRMILQNSRINYITIDEEIESLNLYLELENIRLDNELHYTFEIDDMIDRKRTQIPSMVIQPFVENAILHGLLTKGGEKKVTIRMQKEISHIYCEVEDNGIGRDKARELNEQRTKRHESTGMRATKQRLEILNRNSDKKVSVNIIDLTDENHNAIGTKVQIFIPITNKTE